MMRPHWHLLLALARGRFGVLVGGTMGFLWFLSLGYPALIPTHISWLMEGDRAQHFLGWLFFRNQTWEFPLGALPNFVYPLVLLC